MFSFLHNIPQVTKNILILNILFFIVKLFYASQYIDLDAVLGAYYLNSPLFKPYQIITHFFMHGDFFHILLNMWVFVMFGSILEKMWGPKRFFIFYVISALGAFILYNMIGMYQIYELKSIINSYEIFNLNNIILDGSLLTPDGRIMSTGIELNDQYVRYSYSTMVGASGAIFGITAAFAILFPNTELYIYGAFPVKAKWLIGGYFVYELLQSLKASSGDHIAHLAHVGGAITGAIIVLIWRKTDKKNFW